MNTYFNINYEFDKQEVHRRIEESEKGYICVVDGTIMRIVHQDLTYRKIINNALFSVSDSSWTPFFLKCLYGIKVEPYPGPDLFMNIIKMRKYKMFFMGGNNEVLEALRANLVQYDQKISDMEFYELPFCSVDEFDYASIAQKVNDNKPDIIWVSLGAPKQEIFMNKLNPYLNTGVQIAVGAAFKYYCGLPGTKRAPQWVHKYKLEFMYRNFQEPKKQWTRFLKYLFTLPQILREERKKKNAEKF